MDETYVSRRRVSEEGFNRDFMQEGLENVQYKLFGAWDALDKKKEASDSDVAERPEHPLESWERTASTWTWGVIFGRGGLDLKTRSLCVLAALTVLPREDLVRVWINTCLNVGCTEDEIRELLIWASHFGGMPIMRVHLTMFFDIVEQRHADPSVKMTAAYLPWIKQGATK